MENKTDRQEGAVAAGSATRTTVTPALTSATLIAANGQRKGLRIVFDCVVTDVTQKIWLRPSTSAASITEYALKQQGSGELELFSADTFPYTGAWTIISDVAGGTIQVFEVV